MFEPFASSAPKAKAAHVLIFIIILLAWISCCVTFGGPMIGISYIGLNFDLYSLSATNGYVLEGKCADGGKATLAFAVFAFLGLLLHLSLLFCRISGLSFPMIQDAAHSVQTELILNGFEFFCFFLQVCIYGGTCWQSATSTSGVTATGKGFGLMLAVFFFLLITLVMYVLMRSGNSSIALGEDGVNKANHNANESYSGASSSGDGNQPTFSYESST